MLELLVDPFTCVGCDFLQRALAAGVLTGVAAAVVGTWVVLRGLSFMGDAIAHGVLPGIALAVVTGTSVAIGGAVSALLMVLAIAWVGRRTGLRDDASIGLLFVGMLALGVVLLSREGAAGGDLTAILFGDVVGVTDADVLAAAIAAALAVVTSVVLHRPFLALGFSEDTAALLGARPRLAHVVQLTLLAATVVLGFRTVGTLLVFALLVAPPATAALLTRRVPSMMVVAAALAALAVLLGLLASVHLGTAGSASIALASVLLFLLVVLGRDAVRAVTRA